MSSPIPAFGFTPEAFAPVLPMEQITPEWAFGDGSGRGVKVAVIDSGVDATHPDVGPVNGYVMFSHKAIGSDEIETITEPHADTFGHGTACAATIRRLAPECEIYSVRVLGPMLVGRAQIFEMGLRWAIENGMNVCNMSLGTTNRDFYVNLHELSDLASFKNVTLVTAANNMPQPSFPSVFASVISVAAHEFATVDEHFYNPNPPVDFSAPGIDVRVAWQEHGYITATGNSYAAPYITGLVARILGAHPGLTLQHVKIILRALAANAQAAAE